ncbi:hypothetical protein DLM77_15410 [Leptospira yasudae]|uniref:Lipoprotein n=1 Tax=Leptospira yasudae TaxID=2202201 RepID=A0ABX9LZP3_9LEPT|nr:hypothetical protein DLM77_15410 [Leptospira yasudae]
MFKRFALVLVFLLLVLCKGEERGNKDSTTFLQILNLFSQNDNNSNRSGSGGENFNLQSSIFKYRIKFSN